MAKKILEINIREDGKCEAVINVSDQEDVKGLMAALLVLMDKDKAFRDAVIFCVGSYLENHDMISEVVDLSLKKANSETKATDIMDYDKGKCNKDAGNNISRCKKES